MPMLDVPQDVKFPDEELKILKYWDEIDAFQESLRRSREEKRPLFSFYDGPPFATGMPHYGNIWKCVTITHGSIFLSDLGCAGHILAGTIKDCVTRYAHMNGFHVERKWGWDCHGLPVEYEIDQKLGIKCRDDVFKMTVKAYNEECRSVVMRYASEWKRVVRRLARWIDMERDYKTLDPTFMESVWWVCKQLFDKDLIYRGYKVMPYSTACSTPLSNFEAGQNYKDVSDPEVVISFPLLGERFKGVSLLAWTTTPWTLPSNLAVCVHPEMEYVTIKDNKTGVLYMLATSRICQMYKKESEYSVISTCVGTDLKGVTYEPIFDYFYEAKKDTSFRVLNDTYVTDGSGTGVVHQAPAFGEDDFRVCLAAGVIAKGESVPCPVDDDGRFTPVVSHFAGVHVKEADKAIMAHLKASGRLVKSGAIKHSYPFCWRSDTPLIYKTVPSWFVKVESIKERLVHNNSLTYWVPDFVKEKRFHNWLAGARDWAISRNRFWGTPLPIWRSDDWEEIVCVGSIAELEQLSGVAVTDLHKESVDPITIPSKMGKGVLRRVDEVFDCWFESGSMPYAQCHYPFENKELFESSFPGHFIAEGLDQTRGWFYTLMVLSTALFDKPAFQNVIVNGLVLAADGKKMSKRLKNYPDPELVINSHGADALRLYLINSPVVRAEELRFREEGVKDVVRDVMLPWYNAYRFLVQAVQRSELEDKKPFVGSQGQHIASKNLMDQWIQASAAGLLLFVKKEMEAYRLYTVVPRLLKFIEDLTNWYVKMNRKRLKGGAGAAEALESTSILFEVLLTLTRCMAPFTPLFSELLYQNLKQALPEDQRQPSVHFLPFPTANKEAIDERMEHKVARMQTLIEKGRNARDKRGVSLRVPLRGATVISPNKEVLHDLEELQHYILEELNLRSIVITAEEGDRVVRTATPDNSVLGKRLGKDLRAVSAAIKELSDEELVRYEREGSLQVCGHLLSGEDLKITRSLKGGEEHLQAESYDEVLLILDVGMDESLKREGLVRELLSRVQRLRKQAGLSVQDDIELFIRYPDAALAAAVEEHAAMVRATLRVSPLSVERLEAAGGLSESVIIHSDEELPGVEGKVGLTLTRARFHLDAHACRAAASSAGTTVEALQAALGRLSTEEIRAMLSGGSGVVGLEVEGSGGRVKTELRVKEHLWFTLAALPAPPS